MNESLAKIKAVKERVKALMTNYSTIPEREFHYVRNQFWAEAEKLKNQFPSLMDFTSASYDRHFQRGSYYSWAARELIADIDYFINFINNLESVQLPNLKVTDEGLFFAGQHFDALLKFNDIISTAEKEIILIDNYLNEKVLE